MLLVEKHIPSQAVDKLWDVLTKDDNAHLKSHRTSIGAWIAARA